MPDPNDLFKLKSLTPTPIAKVNIQFYLDVEEKSTGAQDTLPYDYQRTGEKDKPTDGQEVINDINDAIINCWNPICTGVSVENVNATSGFGNGALTRYRSPTWTKPPIVQPNSNPFTNELPMDPKTSTVDQIPLVRFYLGNGASLNVPNHLPGLGINYRFKTSFCLLEQRVGYLFLKNPTVTTVEAFLHELAHVLGLADRYFNALDEGTAGYQAPTEGPFIQDPARVSVPMSGKYIDEILGILGPDTQYDPQRNLMSTRFCSLTDVQRYFIKNNLFEPVSPLGLAILVPGNPACTRLMDNNTTGCVGKESKYRPAYPQNVGTPTPSLLFDTPTGVAVQNVLWRNESGSNPTLGLLTGDKPLWDSIQQMLNEGMKDGPTLTTLKQLANY